MDLEFCGIGYRNLIGFEKRNGEVEDSPDFEGAVGLECCFDSKSSPRACKYLFV